MKHNKTQTFWTVWNLIEGFLILAAGVLCIIFRTNETLAKSIAFVIGSFVILDGVCRIVLVASGKKETDSSFMLVGGFEISLGILVLLQYNTFITLLVQFLFIILMVVGGLLVLFSILSIVKKKSTLVMPILEIIFGALLVGLGVAICIIFNKNDQSSQELVLLIIGIILALTGLAQVIITIIQSVRASKKANALVATDEVKAPEYGEAKEVKEEPVEEAKAIEKEEEPKKLEKKASKKSSK